jgi:RNA polymerase sigma-70 factor, ECF subfamily
MQAPGGVPAPQARVSTPRPDFGNNWVNSFLPMDSEIDLQSLMARYTEGDSAAATVLVSLLSPQLHRFFQMQFVSRRHADDLLQETWMRIHQVRQTYRVGQPVLPWLYAIARNVRVDHYRKAHRAESREERLEEGSHIPEAPPDQSTGTPDIEALLATLPESQREVIVMLKVSGMSLEEVARATSSSVGSVKQKAHRAYERLRKGLSGGGPNAGRIVFHEG